MAELLWRAWRKKRDAPRLYEEAAKAFSAAGYLVGEAYAFRCSADIHENLKKPQQALSDLRRALDLYRQASDADGEREVRQKIALLRGEKEDIDSAKTSLQAAVER
jgi:hypothetical protein